MHTALLVRSVEHAAARLRARGFAIGPTEEWEGEGTREIYVERDRGNPLLLMEPMKAGAYQRALEKRGPGLHHLAINVPELEPFLLSLAPSGWLLHPRSLATMSRARTAYLARPGFPALIEVQEAESGELPLFVEAVGLGFPPELARLLAPIGLEAIVQREPGAPWITCAGERIPLSELLEAEAR